MWFLLLDFHIKIKHTKDRNIEHYIVFLVVKCLLKIQEVGFHVTFSPIVKLTITQVILSTAI